MKTKIALIVLGVCLLFLGCGALGANTAKADIPDDNCYQLAVEKDQALANTPLILVSSGTMINPFTGEMDTYEGYLSDNNGVTRLRRVYGNGDADGYIGMTRYWLAADGRAKVSQRIYGPIWSWYAWGFWWNFPFDDDPSTWVKDKEICNTL